MKMVHMKRDASKKTEGEMHIKSPEYPYGLEITLDKNQLKKLGHEKLEVGSEHTVTAHVKVTRSSVDERDGHSSSSHHLQITHMGIEPKSAKPLKDAPMDEYAERRKSGEKA